MCIDRIWWVYGERRHGRQAQRGTGRLAGHRHRLELAYNPGLGGTRATNQAPKGAAGTPPRGRRAWCQSPCTQPQVAEKRGKRRCIQDTQAQHFNNTNQDWSTLFRFSDALPLWLKTYYSIRTPRYPGMSPDQVSWYRNTACSPSLKGMSHVGIKTFVSPHVNLG